MPCRLALILAVAFVALTAFHAHAEDDAHATTKYLDRLRADGAYVRALASEVRIFVNSGTTDRSAIDKLGARILECLASVRETVVLYKGAPTRFGLQEEYSLLEEIATQAGFLGAAYGRLTGVPPKPPTAEQLKGAREEARKFLKQVIPKLVAQRLGNQGVADVLTADSFEEASHVAAQRVIGRVLSEFDKELTAYIDVGVSGNGIEVSARHATRRLATKYLGKLLAKVTPQTFVVEFVSGVIIRWAGPKLKEALRPKGNLAARVKRSRKVLREAGLVLDRLDPGSSVRVARMAIEGAESAIASTKYLLGDLKRARKVALQEDLTSAIVELQRAINRNRHRFLIGSQIGQKDLTGMLKGLDFLAREIARMRSGARPGPRDPIVPPAVPPRPAAADAVAGRYEIVRDHVQAGHQFHSRVTLTGSMGALAFEFRQWDEGGWSFEGHAWHYKGTVKWIGGQAGAKRTLRGTGRSQWHATAPSYRCTIGIARDERGVWRATRINIGGNDFKLAKVNSAIPR